MANALRMAGRVTESDLRAAGKAEEEESIELRGIDDRVEIIDKSVERDLTAFAVGQAAAAIVERDQRASLGQGCDPGPPDRIVPIAFETREPMRPAYNHWARSGDRKGDPRTVAARAKADGLASLLRHRPNRLSNDTITWQLGGGEAPLNIVWQTLSSGDSHCVGENRCASARPLTRVAPLL